MCNLKKLNIISFIFLLVLAVVCGGFGGWIISQENWNILIFGTKAVQIIGWVLVGTAILILLNVIFGFCGVLRESRCCMISFIIVTLLAFIVLTVSGTLLFVYNNQVKNTVASHLKKEFINKYGIDDSYTRLWNEFQPTYKCCGIDNGADYKSTKWYSSPTNENPKEGEVPSSCCTRMDDHFLNMSACAHSRPEDQTQFIYNKGCWDILRNVVSLTLYWSSIVVFILCGILFLIILIGGIMNRRLERETLYGQVV